MGGDTSIPINVFFLPRKKIPILWKNASILPPVKKKNPGKPINKRLSGISRSFILYDRPLVNTICSGSHYIPTAISIQII